ncbi:helix-turn-helix domain-containing protein [Corynebacterium halotolerans]|uniref:DNA-binding protein, excisionase family n=1 Tax=Corynebacterium halotolerans YIM 70093 = DSM 44683 TaxID=1121362 RepID=M1NNW6_9CORY|nr:helix-turn-helix domain-containing protein [Corynebacterium halotolerans]AGF73023.1 DNA-binding protein, excisionase family [Corynebacterium halotolerans YIM 70093 = DSM 44683]
MSTKVRDFKHRTTVLPPDNLDDMLDLSRFLDQHDAPAALLGPDGEQIQLPLEVHELLTRIVAAMARKRAITISPVDRKLTTQEAADHLGISRPTLIKLIDKGEIACEKPTGSRHRRILLADVLDYQKSLNEKRDQVFEEMVNDAEDDGLYDVDESTFYSAVKEARSQPEGRE